MATQDLGTERMLGRREKGGEMQSKQDDKYVHEVKKKKKSLEQHID